MALSTERQFMETVQRSKDVLVTFRKEWNADAVASALALAHFLVRKGKRVDIVAHDFAATKSLAFLPKIADVKPELRNLQKFVISLDVSKTKIDELSYDMEGDTLRIHVTPKAGRFEEKHVSTASADFKYDCAIILDTPDYGALGETFAANTEFFYRQPTINIDHDPANEQYGNLNVVDVTATSTCEVLYDLLKKTGEHFLHEDVATCLMTGIIAKTRCFKTASVTPKTLDIASALVAAGARRDEIVQHLYRTRSIATLKLWGRALARLKYDPELKMAWTVLVRQDFIHAGATDEHLADVIDELIMNSPDAEIISVLYEQETPKEPGRTASVCALVASEKRADALALVAGLKPEGTRKLARVCYLGSMLDAETAVLAAIRKALGKTVLSGSPPARG